MGMMGSGRVVMVLATALVLAPERAEAKLPDVVPGIMINYVTAIHRPTGCVAKLEFSGTMLVGASITDPLCLPHDVKTRSIPAFKRDFHVPATKRKLFTGH